MSETWNILPYEAAERAAMARLTADDAYVQGDLLGLFDQFPGCGFTARLDGALAGAAAYTGPGPLASCTLYVAPALRRRGAGSALLSALVSHAGKNGVMRLFCDYPICPQNHAFFEKRGFAYSHTSEYMTRKTAAYPPQAEIEIAPYIDALFPEAFSVQSEAFARMRAAVGLPPAAPQPEADVRRDWAEAAGDRFVCISGGRVCGVLLLEDDWIDSLAVSPACQGRGMGTALLRFALSELHRRGYEQARLWVVSGNRAKRLYAREGFATERTHAFCVKTLAR